MTKKKQVGVRFDSNRTRLKTGETQRPNGTYAYRWSTPDGKRHSIYAPTLEKLREQEEQIIVDKHDGIRSDVKSITVNEMFDLWCQLKRGIICLTVFVLGTQQFDCGIQQLKHFVAAFNALGMMLNVTSGQIGAGQID